MLTHQRPAITIQQRRLSSQTAHWAAIINFIHYVKNNSVAASTLGAAQWVCHLSYSSSSQMLDWRE